MDGEVLLGKKGVGLIWDVMKLTLSPLIPCFPSHQGTECFSLVVSGSSTKAVAVLTINDGI